MSGPTPKDQNLYKKLSTLKDEFASAVRLFELDKMGESVRKTGQVLEILEGLIDDLGDSYRDALKKNKFAHLKNDQDEVAECSSKELMDLLIRVERSIGRLESEMNRVHHHPSQIRRFILKRWKPLLVSAGALLLFVFLGKYQYNKQGLLGEYFNDTGFEMAYKKRVDRTIDFNWGFNSPYSKKENFSIRWTGFLIAPEEGPYEISTISDDGARVWLDGQLLIDAWTPHAAQTDRVNTSLTKGAHPIRIEYFEGMRQAQIQLFWKKPTTSRDELQSEIIPPKYLVPYRKYLKNL